MSRKKLDAVGLVLLSLGQLYRRLYFWIRVNLWMALTSLLVVTAPAAQAALYHTIRSGLLDPGDSRVDIRQTFFEGFKYFFAPALLLALANLGALAFIVVAILFWLSFPDPLLRWTSVIAFYGLVMWWVTQPFLFPVLVEIPGQPLKQVILRAIHIAFYQPFFALFFAFLLTLINMVGIILLGPVLLVIPALSALIGIQATWHVTGVENPAMFDVIEWNRKQEEKRKHE